MIFDYRSVRSFLVKCAAVSPPLSSLHVLRSKGVSLSPAAKVYSLGVELLPLDPPVMVC